MLNDLSKRIYMANVDKGFYEDNANVREILEAYGTAAHLEAFDRAVTGQRLALIISEASEALEADRKNINFGKASSDFKTELLRYNDNRFNQLFKEHVKDTKEDEIADILIRVLDFCGANRIDIDFHVKAKLRYNSLRPHKHGKSY